MDTQGLKSTSCHLPLGCPRVDVPDLACFLSLLFRQYPGCTLPIWYPRATEVVVGELKKKYAKTKTYQARITLFGMIIKQNEKQGKPDSLPLPGSRPSACTCRNASPSPAEPPSLLAAVLPPRTRTRSSHTPCFLVRPMALALEDP